MKHKKLFAIVTLALALSGALQAQDKITVTGTVKDNADKIGRAQG